MDMFSPFLSICLMLVPPSGRVSIARRRHVGSKRLHMDSFVSFLDYFTKLYQLQRSSNVNTSVAEQAGVAVQSWSCIL
jgi:hypothetical protein